ncbi:MAG: methylated-DNA--[protein]-cysteine S-methyltransferase [Burkholderiaceae bacterium]
MPAIMMTTPMGPTRIVSDGRAIVSLTWGSQRLVNGETTSGTPGSPVRDGESCPLLLAAREQLLAYFDARLQEFDLPLAPAGSPFQRQVFAAMRAIPFGQTRTYRELADSIGSVARAVGAACGANPIPVIIPCHRVLGSNWLGGFSAAGGVEDKLLLLRLEGSSPVLL